MDDSRTRVYNNKNMQGTSGQARPWQALFLQHIKAAERSISYINIVQAIPAMQGTGLYPMPSAPTRSRNQSYNKDVDLEEFSQPMVVCCKDKTDIGHLHLHADARLIHSIPCASAAAQGVLNS